MTAKLIRWTVAFVIAALPAASARSADAAARRQQANPDALVQAEFQKRIKAYVELRDKMAKGAAELEETDDPAKIREAQLTLAARIREARKAARPGDILTTETAALFRRLMYPELQGAKGRATKTEIKEDAPAAVRLKVNAAYPEGQPLPTVPPNLLANLPKLPEEVEYRIVNRDLILRDVEANIIVDFIPNVVR